MASEYLFIQNAVHTNWLPAGSHLTISTCLDSRFANHLHIWSTHLSVNILLDG